MCYCTIDRVSLPRTARCLKLSDDAERHPKICRQCSDSDKNISTFPRRSKPCSHSMSSTENLPAWKRLGLKLKYAKETPSDQPEHDAPIQYPDINKDHEKRKRSHDSKDKQQRKKAKHEQGRVSKLAVDQHEQPNDHDNEQPSATDRFISSVYGRQSTHGVHKTPQKIKFDDNE